MSKDTVIEARNPEKGTRDDLTDLLREGAKRLITEAVGAELSATLAQFADYKDEAGHRHVVRNAYLPEREALTGIRPASVRAPKIRDRSGARIKFTSALLPPYLRRAPGGRALRFGVRPLGDSQRRRRCREREGRLRDAGAAGRLDDSHRGFSARASASHNRAWWMNSLDHIARVRLGNLRINQHKDWGKRNGSKRRTGRHHR